ncbi:Sorting nexin 2B [Ancistrocladus abbreviatus]
MLGSENQGFTQGFHATNHQSEEMESLVLNDLLTSKSYASYRSAMSTLSESHHHHPFSTPNIFTPADRDPLLSHLSPKSYQLGPGSLDNDKHDDSSRFGNSDDYSDVIISPLQDNNGVKHADGLDSPKINSQNSVILTRIESLSSSSSEYLKITVSNPQKEHQTSNSIVPGAGTYITYLIMTKTNMRGFEGSEFSVRRRFKDVVTLADRLGESYRGFFIPPRPDKGVVESQVMHKQEFVEQRMVALEKYLRRLAAHPVIRKSNELRVFLQVPGKLPLTPSTDVASRVLDGAMKLPKQLLGDSGSVTTAHEVVQPAKGRRDLLRLFKELKQSITNDWGSSKPQIIEEDNEFLRRKEKLRDFELRLADASKEAEVLVKAQQDIGDTMGELGLTFIKLTNFENEKVVQNTQKLRAADMKKVATAAIKASRVYRELNAKTVQNLDTLLDYLGSMLAAHSAFSDRSSVLLTVQTLLSEISSLQSKLDRLESASTKVFDGDKSRHKIQELKETMRVMEDAKNCAIREYEQIKENNRAELERLDREKRTDLLNMLKRFVNDQASCAEKLASLWTKLAEDTSEHRIRTQSS